MLEVRIFDYDVVGADDFMGLVKIPLRELSDKLFHKGWYPLTNEEGEVDQVKVRYTHVPSNPPPLHPPPSTLIRPPALSATSPSPLPHPSSNPALG